MYRIITIPRVISDAGGKLPLHQVLKVAGDILDGLAELHGCDVAVLNLKPENVLLTETGGAVLSDFRFSNIMDTIPTRYYFGTRETVRVFMLGSQGVRYVLICRIVNHQLSKTFVSFYRTILHNCTLQYSM